MYCYIGDHNYESLCNYDPMCFRAVWDGSKETVFLIHGWNNNKDTTWLIEAKDAILEKVGDGGR